MKKISKNEAESATKASEMAAAEAQAEASVEASEEVTAEASTEASEEVSAEEAPAQTEAEAAEEVPEEATPEKLPPEMEKLLAEAEERGYLRGRNESIGRLMREPGALERPLAQEEPGSSDRGDGSPMILSNPRVSIWDR